MPIDHSGCFKYVFGSGESIGFLGEYLLFLASSIASLLMFVDSQ